MPSCAPFENGGSKVVAVECNGEQAKIEAMVEAKEVTCENPQPIGCRTCLDAQPDGVRYARSKIWAMFELSRRRRYPGGCRLERRALGVFNYVQFRCVDQLHQPYIHSSRQRGCQLR